MERKKVILTLSRVFPKSHSKDGINTLFAVKLLSGRKLHTIRKNDKGLWDKKVADINAGKKMLCVREWTGRPYNSEQADIKSFVQVGLQKITMTYGTHDEVPQVWIDGKKVPLETVAQNDGLDVPDFIEWFFGTNLYKNDNNVFEGIVLHFTDFRY